jgi:hypothetical protein
LKLSYSLNATSLADNAGTWVDVNALDFQSTSINLTSAGGNQFSARDGNAIANRTAGITSTITGLSIANNASFFLR